MPEGLTRVSESKHFDVEKRNTSGGFEKKINYDVPREQLVSLLESSAACRQSITFKCYDTPITVSTSI